MTVATAAFSDGNPGVEAALQVFDDETDLNVLEYDWDDSVGHWIYTTSHTMRRALTARLAQEGITLRQWEVLACLSADGDASQCEIAEQMGIEPHTLAGVVRRMERDGWLERECCTQDRRRNRIHPTPKAAAVWSRAVQFCHEVRARAVAGLSPDDLQRLKRTCEQIRENLSQLSAAAPSPCNETPESQSQPAPRDKVGVTREVAAR